MTGALLYGSRPGDRVCELRAGEEDEWDRFVMSSPTGNFYQLIGGKQWWSRSWVIAAFCWWRAFKGALRAFFRSVGSEAASSAIVWSLCRLAVYGGICANDRETYFTLLESRKRWRIGWVSSMWKCATGRNYSRPLLPGRDLYVTFTQRPVGRSR